MLYVLYNNKGFEAELANIKVSLTCPRTVVLHARKQSKLLCWPTHIKRASEHTRNSNVCVKLWMCFIRNQTIFAYDFYFALIYCMKLKVLQKPLNSLYCRKWVLYVMVNIIISCVFLHKTNISMQMLKKLACSLAQLQNLCCYLRITTFIASSRTSWVLKKNNLTFL